MLGTKPRSVKCKANSLPIFLQPQGIHSQCIFFIIFHIEHLCIYKNISYKLKALFILVMYPRVLLAVPRTIQCLWSSTSRDSSTMSNLPSTLPLCWKEILVKTFKENIKIILYFQLAAHQHIFNIFPELIFLPKNCIEKHFPNLSGLITMNS